MKKFLSVLVAICMMLSMIPMTFAIEEAEVNQDVVDQVIENVDEEELTDVPSDVPADVPSDEETDEEESEEMPVFSLKDAFAFVKALDFDGLVGYIGQFLNIETLKYAIDNALEMLGGLGIGDFLDGSILEGIFGSFTDVCATIADVLVELLAMVGIDFDQIVAFINNNEFLSFIASIYTYGGFETPETTEPSEEVVTDPVEEEIPEEIEVPETGVADLGIAAFATLSVAGAAAYVLSRKKKVA